MMRSGWPSRRRPEATAVRPLRLHQNRKIEAIEKELELRTRGQEIVVEVDHSKAVRLDLEPGEISLHLVRLVMAPRPTPRTTAASDLRSAISRLIYASLWATTAPA